MPNLYEMYRIVGLMTHRSSFFGINFMLAIELGDIITQVNRQVIDVEADLFQALEDLQPGDVVEVQVSRLVAMKDELQMKQITLLIKLQPSTQMERNFGVNSMQVPQNRYPLPSR